jgi:spermidine/putrescine transport system permease protein
MKATAPDALRAALSVRALCADPASADLRLQRRHGHRLPAAGLHDWEWFGLLLETPALHEATRNSLIIAVSVSLLATCLGLFAARAATRYRFPAKGGDHGFHHAAAGPAGGDRGDLASGRADAAGPRLAGSGRSSWAIRFCASRSPSPSCRAVFPIWTRASRRPPSTWARRRFSTFRLVTLPLVAPGIVASLLICFTISLDEFIIAFFLSGNAPTLPVYLWGQLRFPARLPMIMALGTILVVLSILLLVVAETFRRRGLRRAGLKDSGGFL